MLNHWTYINHSKANTAINTGQKNLIIYAYSISNNFLKEVFAKIKLKYVITNDIKTASLVIGSIYHLQQNPAIKRLVNKKQIPIYSFQSVSIYKLIKFARTIV